MSEDIFIKAMASAYEKHPNARVSSNFCWSLFKDGADSQRAEIERLSKLYRAALDELVKQGKLITKLADAL